MLLATLFIRSVTREIFTRVAKGIGAFHPDFFALESALEFLKDTQFVVATDDFDLSVHVFKDLFFPRWGDHSLDRHLLREIVLVGTEVTPEHRQGFKKRLEAVIAAEV